MQIACGQKNNRIYALISDIGKKEKMVWTNNNGSLTSGKNKNALQKLVLIFNSRLTLVHHHIWKKNQRIFPKTISTLKPTSYSCFCTTICQVECSPVLLLQLDVWKRKGEKSKKERHSGSLRKE